MRTTRARSATLFLGLALLAVGSAPAAAVPLPAAGEDWIEVRSPNFILFGNATPGAVETIATDLERLRAALAQINPGLKLTSPYPTTIYVFKDGASFSPFQLLYNGRSAEVSGYFLSRSFANYVAIGARPRGDDRALIYHEYLHYLLRNNYPELPLWLNEGLAEYYSTFEVGRGEAKLGLPLETHVAWLRLHPPMPMAKLLALDSSSAEYNEADRRGGFYAQAWALTHYLMSGRGGRAGQLGAILAALRAGESPQAAVRQGLGIDPEELAALDRELALYIKGYSFPYTKAEITLGSEAVLVRSSVSRADVLYRLGDLLANLDDSRRGDAEAYLRSALALQADHGPAIADLARLAEDAGRREEAGRLHEQAARLAPDDWIVQYLYARYLLEEAKTGSLATARRSLERVVALRPEFGDAWADLGYTYQDDRSLGAAALNALETAYRLLPARPEVAFNLALAYVHNGRIDEARRLADQSLRGKQDLASNIRESILSYRYNEVQDLVQKQKLSAALPLLREIQTQTTRPDFAASLGRQIAEIEGVVSHNGFVDRYNAAVERVNRGKLREAAEILEQLAAETMDPYNAQKAKDLLARIRERLGSRKR